MFHLGLRELLEEKTGALLLIAGEFLLIEIVVRALPNFAGFTIQGGYPDGLVLFYPPG